MKTRVPISLFLIIAVQFLLIKNLYSQSDLNWHIGACTSVEFGSGNLVITQLADSVEFGWCNSGFSKNDSTFAAFTNGTTLFRGDGSIMPNGDTLAPTNSTLSNYPLGQISSQSAIFVNKPGNNSLYYLIHEAIDNDTSGPVINNIYYTVVDMFADSGRGIVTSKNNYLYHSTDSLMHGKLQLTKHANGIDWWLIAKKQNSNEFLEWLITADSIIGPQIFNFPGYIGLDSYWGQACFSQSGNYYGIIYRDECFQLFNFDRCSGNMSLIFNANLNDGSGPGSGLAFSRNDQFLYATTGGFCYQFDILATNIFASKKLVATFDGLIINGINYDLQQCRLAPDNKIYICPGSTSYQWSVIQNPELPDTLCNVQQHIISLYCYNNVTFPNLPNLNLGPLPGNYCDSINSNSTAENVQQIFIYPNPCSSYIKIGNAANHQYQYCIIDITGKEITGGKVISSDLIDMEKLSPGLYILQIISATGINRNFRILRM